MQKFRIELERELMILHKNIIRMSSYIEKAMEDMEEALKNQDMDLARAVIFGDDAIDQMERQIVEECLSIIARQQPIATDLRDVSTILKIVTDLERISDHCQDISEYLLLLDDLGQAEVGIDFLKMSGMIKQMLKDMIKAYINEDATLAVKIIEKDDQVDQFFLEGVDFLIGRLESDSHLARTAVYSLYILKYFERIADHIVNIGEWVYYYSNGKRYQRSKDAINFND